MSTMERGNLVQTWLTNAGLHHAVDNFRMAGIDSPRSLVQLELSHFEMLGVTQPEDRKKLFFLMQRVKKALTEEETATSKAVQEQKENYDNCKEDYCSEDFSVETKSQSRNEFGMSVETSSMKEPISPVTLSSPLVMEDKAYDVDGASSLLDNTNTRSYMEQMLKQRATQRQLHGDKASSSKGGVATTSYPSSRQSLMKRYNREVDGACDSRSYLDSRGSDTSFEASVSSKQRRNRRKSGIPTLKSKSSSRRSMSSTISTEKDFIDELDECLKSPIIKDEVDDIATSTTKASVDVRARRISLHSRPTIKKTNQSKPRRLSGIPAPPSIDSKYDDDSIRSDTSDLSTSLHSYSSLSSSSVPSKVHGRSRTNSRASTGSFSSRSSISSRSRLEENQNRNVVKGAKATENQASTAISRRTGKKRLSTIPSSRVAPTSPLSHLTSTQLDESITSQSGVPKLKKNVASNRRRSLGGKAVSSRRPTTANSASSVKSVTSSASKRRPKTTTTPRTPRTQRSAPRSTKSPGMSTLTNNRSLSPMRTRTRAATPKGKRPLSPMKTGTRARATTPRATSPLNRSRAGKVKSPTQSGAVFIHGMPEDTSWATQISQHREAANEEHKEFMSDQKSESSDANYEMRIRVVVRKRPMSKREAAQSGDVDVIHPLEYEDHGRVLVYQPKTKLDLTKEVEVSKFAFDNVYDEKSNNLDIYNTSVKNLIPGVFHGKWASVFAYGQTGSGKTFTMMGSGLTGMKAGNQAENMCDANLGLYCLAAQDVFQLAEDPQYEDISINCSLFEIYGGKLFDLLNNRQQIRCLEDSRGKVCFPGLSEHPVGSAEDLMGIIEAGSLNRSTGQTQANSDSSRSHAVLQLSLRKNSIGRSRRNVECGRLSFIDLAGSERGADTANTCRTTRMEGAEINKSLLALKEVIRALATGDSMKRIPFRGSKLTQVLKEGFVGKNSRTVMVTCVAPNMNNCDHTLNTLRYADRVKERDPETGALSAAVAASSRIQMDKSLMKPKLPPRPLTAPATSFRIERDVSSDDEEVPPPPSPNFDTDDSASFDMIEDNDSITLTQPPTVNDQTPSPEKPISRVEATTLIETHKSVQASMLQILKREVALVNKPETTDLAAIERYFHELDSISNEQMTLLTTLKQALQSYFEEGNRHD